MHREHHRWWSPALNQDMEIGVYGHGGRPVVVFPSSSGRFYDFEGFGMVDAVQEIIDAGRVTLFAVDSVDGQSWENFGSHPADRNRRHNEYDSYIVHEALPFVRSMRPHGSPLGTGCSMGAYHAVNFYLRHPDAFGGFVAMSGLYRLDRSDFRMSSQDIEFVYLNSPIHYLPSLNDSWFLDHYRQGQLVLCVGQGPWEQPCFEDTRDVGAILESKGVPRWLDMWGHDVAHDWPWWRKQLPYFLDRLCS